MGATTSKEGYGVRTATFGLLDGWSFVVNAPRTQVQAADSGCTFASLTHGPGKVAFGSFPITLTLAEHPTLLAQEQAISVPRREELENIVSTGLRRSVLSTSPAVKEFMEGDLGGLVAPPGVRKSNEEIFEEGRSLNLVSHAQITYYRNRHDEQGLDRLAACVSNDLNYVEYVHKALTFLRRAGLHSEEALERMALRDPDLRQQISTVSSALQYPVLIEAMEKHFMPLALAEGLISKGQAEALSAISNYPARERELQALKELVELKKDLLNCANTLHEKLSEPQRRLLHSAKEQLDRDLHQAPHLVRSETYLRRFEGLLEFLTDYDNFANLKPVLVAAAQG